MRFFGGMGSLSAFSKLFMLLGLDKPQEKPILSSIVVRIKTTSAYLCICGAVVASARRLHVEAQLPVWATARAIIHEIRITILTAVVTMTFRLCGFLCLAGRAIRPTALPSVRCLLVFCLALSFSLELIQTDALDASNNEPDVTASPTLNTAELPHRDIPIRLELPLNQQRWLSPMRSFGRTFRSSSYRSSAMKNGSQRMSGAIQPSVHLDRQPPDTMPFPQAALTLLC